MCVGLLALVFFYFLTKEKRLENESFPSYNYNECYKKKYRPIIGRDANHEMNIIKNLLPIKLMINVFKVKKKHFSLATSVRRKNDRSKILLI